MSMANETVFFSFEDNTQPAKRNVGSNGSPTAFTRRISQRKVGISFRSNDWPPTFVNKQVRGTYLSGLETVYTSSSLYKRWVLSMAKYGQQVHGRGLEQWSETDARGTIATNSVQRPQVGHRRH